VFAAAVAAERAVSGSLACDAGHLLYCAAAPVRAARGKRTGEGKG